MCSVSFTANINLLGCDRHGAVLAEREKKRLAWPFLADGVKSSLGLPEAGRRAELPGGFIVIWLYSFPFPAAGLRCPVSSHSGWGDTLHAPRCWGLKGEEVWEGWEDRNMACYSQGTLRAQAQVTSHLQQGQPRDGGRQAATAKVWSCFACAAGRRAFSNVSCRVSGS